MFQFAIEDKDTKQTKTKVTGFKSLYYDPFRW